MEDITERLQNLEEDGKQYAHFFSHQNHPGYFGIWVRERTPEYINLWLPHSPLSDYTLACSIEMSDTTFCEYVSQLFTDQIQVSFLKRIYKIDNLNEKTAICLSRNFYEWKQEQIRLNRVKWLQQYPWIVSVPNSSGH